LHEPRPTSDERLLSFPPLDREGPYHKHLFSDFQVRRFPPLKIRRRMSTTDLLSKYGSDLKILMRSLIDGEIDGDVFWRKLQQARSSLIDEEQALLRSFASSDEDLRNNHSMYYDRYSERFPQNGRLMRFVDHLSIETYYYAADDEDRADLNAQDSKTEHYLDAEELRALVAKLYDRAVQDGLWQDEEAAGRLIRSPNA
jgi:hypothetical protein